MSNLSSNTPPSTLSPDPLDYELPESAIARDPLPDRSSSRLLVAGAEGEIEHHRFSDLPTLLPPGALLVRNVSRVVRARVPMARTSGGRVEIFLLEPVAPSNDPALAIAATGSTTWRCLVGGARKFRREPQLTLHIESEPQLTLRATLEGIDDEGATVRFEWEPAERSFAEVLERVGEIPLPPYLDRESRPEDAERYQTVFARTSGAVAAPTAGLHFTPEVLAQLESAGVEIADLVLHVGAGTFKPISGSVAEHTMHRERFAVERSTLRRIIAACERRESENAPIVPVGTTSVRVLESLYWLGTRLIETGRLANNLGVVEVEQWEPYSRLSLPTPLPTPAEALSALADHLDREGEQALDGTTGIMIVPGYRFALCDALITNFHQPRSTLLLLVAAIVGERWRAIYREALAEGYRFLSYGDSSMLGQRIEERGARKEK